jgi:hypothetical protein
MFHRDSLGNGLKMDKTLKSSHVIKVSVTSFLRVKNKCTISKYSLRTFFEK